jgi:hypothetical protein
MRRLLKRNDLNLASAFRFWILAWDGNNDELWTRSHTLVCTLRTGALPFACPQQQEEYPSSQWQTYFNWPCTGAIES